MCRLFFAPVSSGELYNNYYKSVVIGINISALRKYNIDLIGYSGKVRLWGIRNAKKSTFDKTCIGDLVCFYKEGVVIGYGLVDASFVNPELSKEIWGYFQKKSTGEIYLWQNIIVINQFEECVIPFQQFIDLGGYNAKFSIRGYIMLNETGTKRIITKFGSLPNFFKASSVPH